MSQRLFPADARCATCGGPEYPHIGKGPTHPFSPAKRTPANTIRARIVGMMQEHGLDPTASDFRGDTHLEAAVTELRWCLRLIDEQR